MRLDEKLNGSRIFVHCRRLTEKKALYSSHVEFLETCKNNGLTPRGFQIKWKLNLNSGKYSKQKIGDILSETSTKLTEEAIEVCRRELELVDKTLVNEISKLTPDDATQMKMTIDTIYDTQMKKTSSTKQRKFDSLIRPRREKRSYKNNQSTTTPANVNSAIILNVKGDGNCFFRCLSLHFFNNENQHDALRQEIVAHMKRNETRFKEFAHQNIVQYLENMSKTDGRLQSYATEGELLAASECYEIEIYIQTLVRKDQLWNRYSFSDDCDHNKSYVTIIHENEHFKLVRNLPRPCTCNNLLSQAIANTTPIDSNSKDVQMKHGVKVDLSMEGNFNTQKESQTTQTFKCEKRMKKLVENSEVYNLSNKTLRNAQIKLLSKGLKFVPTKKTVDIGKLIADLKLWERRMRLREFFFYHQETSETEAENTCTNTKGKKRATNTIKSGKKFTPKEGRNRWLDQNIEEVKNDVIKSEISR